MNTVPKRIWVILGISIAANLFFAGLIAGRVVTHRDRPHHAAFEDELGPRGFLKRSGLREAGPEVKQLLRARREQLKANMRTVGQTREQVRAALEADPYNPQAAATTFARTREATSQLQSDLHNTLLEVADKLTPAQRKRLAESLWPHRSKR